MRVPRTPRAALVAALGLLSTACIDTPAITSSTDDVPSANIGKIIVVPATLSIVAGSDAPLDVRLEDHDGNPISGHSVVWASSDTTIATVDSAGVVTAVRPGKANVIAIAGTLSAQAIVEVAANSTPPKSDEKAPTTGSGSLYSGYSPTSPHWSHIRTLATDFYYHWTPAERAWAGQHFDGALSGNGNAWRAVNSGVLHLPYTLLWTVLTPNNSEPPSVSSVYYEDMKRWYAEHPQYRFEDAFLHTSTSKSPGTRVEVMIWDSDRYLINPADPGARAYTIDRYLRIVRNEEGAFVDEAASGDILPRVKAAAELDLAQYQSAYTSLLADIKRAFGSKVLMLNTAEYTKDFDRANAIAAGAVHLELFNNPMYAGMPARWQWVDELLSHGVIVDMGSPYPAKWADDHSAQYPKGNYPTSGQRMHMWQLASYYMSVGASPEGFYFHPKGPTWDTAFSDFWFKALEADIGHPMGARRVFARGTDPTGRGYTVYSREFDRALVLIRPPQGWDAQSYGDATAVDLTLPSGEVWVPLRGDGTLGAPVTKVRLRNSESLILVKKSRL